MDDQAASRDSLKPCMRLSGFGLLSMSFRPAKEGRGEDPIVV
jgi:hypothetical protein